MMYSVVVVGAGMIGSSAAKWASEICGRGVALVGMSEPSNKSSADLFGAWYDEGRMTRLFDRNKHWKELAKKSVGRYREIEQRSGVKFYSEVGFLSLVDNKFPQLDSFNQEAKNLHREGFRCDYVDQGIADKLFPYLNLSADVFGYFQPDHSGHISPRGMVRAQKTIAESNHCDLIEASVLNISKHDNDFQLLLSNGDKIKSQKVILATGAYLNLSHHLTPFLPPDQELYLTLTTQSIAYLRIPDREAARLATMPSIVTTFTRGPIDGTYILPPIHYPDGRFYLKLGHFSLGQDKYEGVITTGQEMLEWYRVGEGDNTAVQDLASFLQSLIKDLVVEEVSGGCCVTSKTETKEAPYIGEVCEGLVVAGGGCGYAAKSCDEIGRIAAVLATGGGWDSDIPADVMKIQYRRV